MKRTLFSILSLCTLALASCQRNSLPPAANVIGYKVAVTDIATKGELVNNNDNGDYSDIALEDALSQFMVAAYNGSSPVFTTPGLDPANVETVSYTGGSWSMPNTYYWPQATLLTFFAYTNLPASGSSVAISSAGQTLTHGMVPSVAEQKDILLGWYMGNGSSTGTAEIRFRHPLTSVIFREGDMPGVTGIKSITLSGLASGGTVSMTADGLGAWTVASDAYTASAILGDGSSAIEIDGSTKVIGKDNGAFLLIPQNLDAESGGHPVTLSIVLITDDGDSSFSAEIASGEWQAGKSNIYTVKFGIKTIELSLEVTPLDGIGVSDKDYIPVNFG